MTKVTLKYLTHNISKKALSEDGKVIIEGWANRKIVDSCRELMIPTGAKLDRFNQNPMLLFNHDRDYPIGKVIEIKLDDENGVWVKAEISQSDEQKIRFVRDLISEGILKTFSVGYIEKNFNKAQDGTIEVTEWELHEVSVVTIPMNEASTFQLAKSLETKNFDAAMAIIRDAQTGSKKTVVVENENEEEDKPQVPSAPPPAPPASDESNPPPPPAPADQEDDEQKTREEFQRCVSDKIPKLIDEGKPQDQAIAIAISMCREEGKCSLVPTDEDWKHYAEIASSKVAQIVPSMTNEVSQTPEPQNDLLTRMDAMNKNLVTLVEIASKIAETLTVLVRAEVGQQIVATPEELSADPATGQKNGERIERIQKMFQNIDETLKATFGV